MPRDAHARVWSASASQTSLYTEIMQGSCEKTDSHSVTLGQGLRSCISNMFPGDAKAVDPQTTSGRALGEMHKNIQDSTVCNSRNPDNNPISWQENEQINKWIVV